MHIVYISLQFSRVGNIDPKFFSPFTRRSALCHPQATAHSTLPPSSPLVTKSHRSRATTPLFFAIPRNTIPAMSVVLNLCLFCFFITRNSTRTRKKEQHKMKKIFSQMRQFINEMIQKIMFISKDLIQSLLSHSISYFV